VRKFREETMSTINATAPILAQQVNCTGSFELPCSADAAFPLFSPEGERAWVKEWDPRPLFPETIEFRSETVFRQGEGIEQAFWTIVDVDWTTHRAEYVRVAPQSHAAHIVVKVEPVTVQRCRVDVRFTVTAFAEHGHSLLESFSESAYDTKMRNWEKQITEHLRKN
jgi:hypothetical protein